jgi:NAD(P)-dependent dehydrogenase (short-subunit alcohol dehydrogenase family)
LITDGTDPIGRATALQLALNGAYVIVGVPMGVDADGSIEDLKMLGTLASAVNCDLRKASGVDELIKAVEDQFGRLDLLVNCLKFRPQSAFLEMSESEFDETYTANVRSVLMVVQKANRLMSGRSRARIVNVLSSLDSPETAENPGFAASQAALEGMTVSMSVSLPNNFRVNAISVSEAKSAVPTGDPELFQARPQVSPDDAARAILFLLSSEATSVNGQIVRLK